MIFADSLENMWKEVVVSSIFLERYWGKIQKIFLTSIQLLDMDH